MKKQLAVMAIGLVIALTACGGSHAEPKEEKVDVTTESIAEATTEAPEATQKDFDGEGISDMGDGIIYLVNESGSTENGDEITVYAGDNDLILSLELDAWKFDGKLLSYIYVDGILNTKEQLGDTQMDLSLSDHALSEGKHKVEVVQYKDNDESTVVTYKSAEYTTVRK